MRSSRTRQTGSSITEDKKGKKKKFGIICENSDNSVLVAAIVRKKLRKMAQTALVLKEHFGDGNKNIKRCLTKQT